MKVKISSIKVNTGRREATPQSVEELTRSIAAVTLDQNNTLIAGLHRLEAAKLLGWTEIECNIIGMNGLQSELAEIDENIVRTKLTKQELGDQLLRRKELYEMLHPETRQGMRNGQTSKNANLASLETKSFAQDTSEKTGMSQRTVSFSIEARVPSILIAGGSNFPVRQKEKQNAARDRNMEDWNEIQGLFDKIRSTGMGGISADDP